MPSSCTSAALRTVVISSSVQPSSVAASAASCAHRRLWPAMYGDFRSTKSATTVRASSSSPPSSVRCGSGSRSSTASHGSSSSSRSNQPRPCSANRSASAGSYVRSRRSRAAATASAGEKRRADGLHVVAEVHDAHRLWDLFAARAGGESLAVPTLEGEAQGVAYVGADVEASHQHVGDLAAGREVVHRPVAGRRRGSPGRSPHAPPGQDRRSRTRARRCITSAGLAASCTRVCGADGDLVAEDGRDFVRVPGAPDIAQQRDPVDGLAQLPVEACFLTEPGGQQTRPQLGLQRLAERVVLCQGEGGDELTKAQGRTRDSAPPVSDRTWKVLDPPVVRQTFEQARRTRPTRLRERLTDSPGWSPRLPSKPSGDRLGVSPPRDRCRAGRLIRRHRAQGPCPRRPGAA